MDTLERFQIKFVQRDRELNKRAKRAKMNRFGELVTKKTTRKRNDTKHAWLNQKDEQ